MAENTMLPQNHFVFVYGTLKRGQPNHQVLQDEANGRWQFVATGQTTQKFPLFVGMGSLLPFLLYKPHHGKHIQGEIICVDSKMLEFLDDFEEHPNVYQRDKQLILVTDSAKPDAKMNSKEEVAHSEMPRTIECWTYFIKKFPPKILEVKELISDYDAYAVQQGMYSLENEQSAGCDIYTELVKECEVNTKTGDG